VFWFGDVNWSMKMCSGLGMWTGVSRCVLVWGCKLEYEDVFWFGDVNWSMKMCSGLGMWTGV